MARVLVVDDNPDQRESLEMLLEQAGHTVAAAPNGRAALVQVLEETPDVVLLDLSMPEMDGPSFLKVLRSYFRLQSLPVVLLTGQPDSEMADVARALKVSSVLTKGTASPQEVLRAVEDASASSLN